MKAALCFCLLAVLSVRVCARERDRDAGEQDERHNRPARQQQAPRAVSQNPARTVTAPGVPTRTRVIVPRDHHRVPDAPKRDERRRETDKRVPADHVPGRRADQGRAQPPRRVWEQPSRPPARVEDRRQAKAPDRDDHGNRIDAKPFKKAPDHAAIVNNPAIVKNVSVYNRNEIEVNRYYWHNDGGVRYCHYYDGGVHWYGWYVGPRYYWTRYYANAWWWYDPAYARWLWWDDGYWWWRDRAVAYVYNDGNYVAYNDSTAAVPAVSTPTDAQHGDAYYSPDGSRLVQIYGDRNEAFLYARYAGEEPEFLTFLGRDVKKVDFSDTKDPDKLQILLTFKDGHLEVLDNRGGRQN